MRPRKQVKFRLALIMAIGAMTTLSCKTDTSSKESPPTYIYQCELSLSSEQVQLEHPQRRTGTAETVAVYELRFQLAQEHVREYTGEVLTVGPYKLRGEFQSQRSLYLSWYRDGTLVAEASTQSGTRGMLTLHLKLPRVDDDDIASAYLSCDRVVQSP